MRRTVWTLTISMLVALGPMSPATAATEDVAILGISAGFDPGTVTIDPGDTVRWTNDDGIDHTSTQSGSLGLWDSGPMDGGEVFSVTLFAAGTYPYRCTIHAGRMSGRVRVAPAAAMTAGGSIRVTVASAAGTDGFEFDVQRRDPGEGWEVWKRGVTRRTVRYSPPGDGEYDFRSRLTHQDGGASGWSPAVSVTV